MLYAQISSNEHSQCSARNTAATDGKPHARIRPQTELFYYTTLPTNFQKVEIR